ARRGCRRHGRYVGALSRPAGSWVLRARHGEHRADPGAIAAGPGPTRPDPIPVLVLARLALDRQEQGTGLGGDLLLDALIRSVAGARHYGARALVVDAIDDRAAEFYGHHGFLPLEGRRLYRRISDIARALGV
ncbi:histone acetyltransferase, partial [Mycobacterium tuberculosis]